ncbi:hypothetical protein Hypma_012646 [Hypsizygus marmoreus]|uniref:Cytochrome P450 n=1 Tax=Hypsizygus marmoreus TaxID=39966 RepID=A0A369JI28_HYPMA|nr:hypothetical protein Hypma_012646 [Hypsizygus marmoreus]
MRTYTPAVSRFVRRRRPAKLNQVTVNCGQRCHRSPARTQFTSQHPRAAVNRGHKVYHLAHRPTTSSWFGFSAQIIDTLDHGQLFEDWERQHGSVFQLPTLFGMKVVILCDPKAVAHFFSKDTYTYRQTPATRVVHELFFGKNLLWAEADTHRRQRKALSTPFSNSAIRDLTPVFYDSAYALKASWDTSLQSTTQDDGVTIDVQAWMNRVSLDSIGIAGFSHDFESLSGKSSPIVAAFESLGSAPSGSFMKVAATLAPLFPWIYQIPSGRKRELDNLAAVMTDIANDLMARAKVDRADKALERSIIGALIRSETSNSTKQMSSEEIIAQV